MAERLSYVMGEDEGAESEQRQMSAYKKIYNSNGTCLTQYFPPIGDKIKKLCVRADDVWLCSVPRSGTRWVQEAIWCIANNADIGRAKNWSLDERFPYLEKSAFMPNRRPDPTLPAYFYSLPFIQGSPSPRFIKSLLPATLLPEQLMLYKDIKLVYLSRNPRDTCVSYCQFMRRVDVVGSFEQFCEQFMEGKAPFLPYWDHVLPFWHMREDPNILRITYEEMKKDLKSGILKIAAFLNKTLTDRQVQQLLEYLSLENIRSSTDLSEGELDISWKDLMSPAMVERFERWEQEQIGDSGYPLVYE